MQTDCSGGVVDNADRLLGWSCLQMLLFYTTLIKKTHLNQSTKVTGWIVYGLEVWFVCYTTLKRYVCSMVPYRMVSYHCWCPTLLASPTSHSSSKLDVKMRNYCASRDCCLSLQWVLQQYSTRNYSYKGQKTIRWCIASPLMQVRWGGNLP